MEQVDKIFYVTLFPCTRLCRLPALGKVMGSMMWVGHYLLILMYYSNGLLYSSKLFISLPNVRAGLCIVC